MFECSLAKLKSMKAAILEIFQGQRNLFQDLIAEAWENIALVKAIDEGKGSEPVRREVIFEILESGGAGCNSLG